MERDYFIYKSHCEIVFVTDEIAPDAITDELGVTPTRSFRKGRAIGVQAFGIDHRKAPQPVGGQIRAY